MIIQNPVVGWGMRCGAVSITEPANLHSGAMQRVARPSPPIFLPLLSSVALSARMDLCLPDWVSNLG